MSSRLAVILQSLVFRPTYSVLVRGVFDFPADASIRTPCTVHPFEAPR